MRYRKLDANGDYSFGGNSNNFLTDKEAVRQAVTVMLICAHSSVGAPQQ